jgi:hypothetical protein
MAKAKSRSASAGRPGTGWAASPVVAILPAPVVRSALGYERVLSEVDVDQYAAAARMRLRPVA